MSPGWVHGVGKGESGIPNLYHHPKCGARSSGISAQVDTIGDVLMTTPAIRALKESHPSRRITLLTSSAGAATASLVLEIDEVIVYDAPWLKATSLRIDSRLEYEMAERLRHLQFDAAVIFTVYSQSPLPSALLCSGHSLTTGSLP